MNKAPSGAFQSDVLESLWPSFINTANAERREIMRTIKLAIDVQADESIRDTEIARIVEKLINVGLADADRTLIEGEGDVEDAELVTCIQIASPVPSKSGYEFFDVPCIEELAENVHNSESDEGCDPEYTVVHKPKLMALLNGVREGNYTKKAIALSATQKALESSMQTFESSNKRIFEANTFFRELLDSVETLGGIAEVHGFDALTDLMYLQAAIIDNGRIAICEKSKPSLEIIKKLPSASRWMEFVEIDNF